MADPNPPSFESYGPMLGSLLASEAIPQYAPVTIFASDDVQIAENGGRVDGVAYVDCLSGSPPSIVKDGIVIVKAGGSFSDGDTLVPGTAGRVVVSTTGAGSLIALQDAEVDAEVRAYLKERAAGSPGVPEVITNTPGAISVDTLITFLNPDGTDAMTLASGRYDGQEKIIRELAGSNTPISVITGAFNNDGTTANTLTLNATGEGVHLVWLTNVWRVVALLGTSPTFTTV